MKKILCKICKVNNARDKHHLIPKSQGGLDSEENLIYICEDCHYKIHHTDWVQGDIDQFNKEYKQALRNDLFSEGWGIIPNKILRDQTISSFAKLLYCEISSLCASKGYCWASNRHFAEAFNVNSKTVSRAMTELEKYVIYENRTSGQRRIWVHSLVGKHGQKSLGNLDKNVHVGMDKNVRHNSNSIKKNIKFIGSDDPISEIWDLKEEIEKLKKSPQKHIQLIGEYFEEKKLEFANNGQFKAAFNRHLKDAAQLAQFSDEQIGKATVVAEKDYPQYTLGTLVKILTR